MLLALFVSSARAHDCGPPRITLNAGESCSWTITADRVEVSSIYTPNLTGIPGVAFVVPFAQFSAKHGVFTITGQTPGTNRLTVNWLYPGNGAAGICFVDIVVLPASTNQNLQTLIQEGALCSWDGSNIIRAKILRDAIDHYIPAAAKKLLIFTQCYGGSMALSDRFYNMSNTAVLSATSPNQTAKFGGYDDDSARALQPGVGRTARDVHEAGCVGKKTLPPMHGLPPPSKTNDLAGSEWPRTSGALALNDFSLASVSGSGPIRSRHIVIYAGNPSGASIQSSVHDGATIPDAAGNQTNQVSDAAYRDAIKQNFQNEPFTTIHSVGGAPRPGDSSRGQNGWDYPGDLAGLERALREAGDAIRNSADPAAEQFILFITDHGAKGWLAPNPTSPGLDGDSVTAAIRGLRIQDPTLAPTIDAMRADPENRCGFFLELIGAPPPGPQLQGLLPVPNLRPGDFAVEIRPTNAPSLRFTGFTTQVVDFDGDGQIGSVPGEAICLFFPVEEAQLIALLQSQSLDVLIDNRTPTAFHLTDFEFTTGAIAKPATLIPPPWIVSSRRVSAAEVELTVRGIAWFAYAIESSTDLVNWQRATPVTFFNDVTALRGPGTGGRRYYRVAWVNQ